MFDFIVKRQVIGNIIALGHGCIAVFAPQQAHVLKGTQVFADGYFGYIEYLRQIGNGDAFFVVNDIQELCMADMQYHHPLSV